MHKSLKNLAPLVLSVFFFSAVGPGWGEEGKIYADVKTPIKVFPEENFEIRAAFYTIDDSSTKTPILEDIVKLSLPEGFSVKNEPPLLSNKGERIYQLKASKNEGRFTIEFHIVTSETTTLTYEIEVFPRMVLFRSLGIILGGYYGATYGGTETSGADPYGPTVSLVGFTIGLIGGVFLGGVIGSSLDNAIEKNEAFARFFYPINYPFYLGSRLISSYINFIN